MHNKKIFHIKKKFISDAGLTTKIMLEICHGATQVKYHTLVWILVLYFASRMDTAMLAFNSGNYAILLITGC